METEHKSLSLAELSRVRNRITFYYVEHAKINQQRNMLLVTTSLGGQVIFLPAGDLAVMMLGPGCVITSEAQKVLSDCGCTCVWTGEQGVRTYGVARPLTNKATYAIAQARVIANPTLRLAAAKQMYQWRYEGIDINDFGDIDDLRRWEGRVTRQLYPQLARQVGLTWTKRKFTPGKMKKDDPLNQAMTCATQCLYGLCLAVINALGAIPSLGIIHQNEASAFVYDLADLYKFEVAIPIAFRTVADGVKLSDLPKEVRYRMRDFFQQYDLMGQIIADLKALLNPKRIEESLGVTMTLWNDQRPPVPYGYNYANLSDLKSGQKVEDSIQAQQSYRSLLKQTGQERNEVDERFREVKETSEFTSSSS